MFDMIFMKNIRSGFYVIQYSNSLDLVQNHAAHMDSVKQWCNRYNYNYKLIVTAGKDGYKKKWKLYTTQHDAFRKTAGWYF